VTEALEDDKNTYLFRDVTQALEDSVSDPDPGWQKLPTKIEKSS
jgi:hypothetical protein